METKIEKINDQGLGICYVNNKITFVDNTVIDDLVDIKIIKQTSKYNIAKVNKYLKYSTKRVNKMCPYKDICGGCKLGDLSYEDTLVFKENKIKNSLKKYTNISADTEIISSKPLAYRNKITLHVKDKMIGYYEINTNNIVSIDRCNIAMEPLNKIIPLLKDFNINNGEIVLRTNGAEILIYIKTDDKVKNISLPTNVVGLVINDKLIYGKNYICEIVNNIKYQVSYNSFFQINLDIASKLFLLLKKHILKDKKVLDLYCGVGALGLQVADISKKVYGIEVIENAIINAKENARINNIFNVEYFAGDVAKVIRKIKDDIEVIIIDPPRSGVDKTTLEVITKFKPKQIIYVSCNVITLARDLNYLNDYEIEKIYGLDMFSFTPNVECLCILKLSNKYYKNEK